MIHYYSYALYTSIKCVWFWFSLVRVRNVFCYSMKNHSEPRVLLTTKQNYWCMSNVINCSSCTHIQRKRTSASVIQTYPGVAVDALYFQCKREVAIRSLRSQFWHLTVNIPMCMWTALAQTFVCTNRCYIRFVLPAIIIVYDLYVQAIKRFHQTDTL